MNKKSVILFFYFSWIHEGIQEHQENVKKLPHEANEKIVFEPQIQANEALGPLLGQLHQIGYNEDEIESILENREG